MRRDRAREEEEDVHQEEAQRGVVSTIDTIDFEGDDIVDLRGWVRAFEETGEAIYLVSLAQRLKNKI